MQRVGAAIAVLGATACKPEMPAPVVPDRIILSGAEADACQKAGFAPMAFASTTGDKALDIRCAKAQEQETALRNASKGRDAKGAWDLR